MTRFVIVFLVAFSLSGCAGFAEFLDIGESAAADEELQRRIAEIRDEIKAIRDEAKETGKLDLNRILDLQEDLAGAQSDLATKTEGKPWYNQMLYALVAGALGYLGIGRPARLGFNAVRTFVGTSRRKK